MNTYDKRDIFTHKDYLNTAADLSENNDYITETAGFIPLEVKLKQFEQNGMIAQFKAGDFTSNDYREIYLNPDFDITPEDDFEDIQEKLELQRNFIEKYKAAKSLGATEKAGTEQPEEEKPKEDKTE